MEEYENTTESFKKFLSTFSDRDAISDDAPLPFRLQSYVLAEYEIKGEILAWSMMFLDQLHCPDFLKFSLVSEVTKDVMAAGLENYQQEKVAEKEDNTFYYQAALLAKATYKSVQKICLQWNQNLPNFSLPSLNPYSICGIKNTRRKMEDKHTVITDLNTLLDLKDHPQTQYYAIFDGHGGLDASTYASKHLHLKLAEQNSFQADLEDALKKSILEIDENYCKKSENESLRSGTTAVVAVIRENVLYLSWIGDSQAVLVSEGKPVTLMDPHKPDREDEKQRIESLGGCVIWFGAWRVNGTLSVSRAIGDADHKPYVCGDADTSRTEFSGSEEYLCIACDGFWDVFNGNQLIDLVSEHMKDSGDRKTLARKLCEKAKAAGSSDNITVLVVFLSDKLTLVNKPSNEEEKGAVASKETNPTNNAEASAKNANNNNSSTNNSLKDDTPPEGSVMVHGCKLQPALKSRTPHKLFINKPHNVNSKISVIVTESAPHAKLPRSVITHKSPWHSPQISPPAMRRRDTRGSLLSMSTCENDVVTTPLNLWTRESHVNGNTYNTYGFFPALVPEQRNGNQQNSQTSPSPSCASEPSILENKILIASSIHYPAKPTIRHQSRGRVPYRASIIMNTQHSEEIARSNRSKETHQRHRDSNSVPEYFRRIRDTYGQGGRLRPQSLSQGNVVDWDRRKMSFHRRTSFHQGLIDSQKENLLLLDLAPLSSQPNTDIAITNSLYTTIKPKKTKKGKKAAVLNGASLEAKRPVKVLHYRKQRSRSAL